MSLETLKTDLKLQYKGFRICFWSGLISGSLMLLSQHQEIGVLLGILGLVSGGVANQKHILMMIKDSQDNQILIDKKIDKLLASK